MVRDQQTAAERVQVSTSHPIGDYVVDFVCLERRLIVEVDGGQHGEQNRINADKIRTRWLENEGFSVIRFWNSEVISNLDGVLIELAEALRFNEHEKKKQPEVD